MLMQAVEYEDALSRGPAVIPRHARASTKGRRVYGFEAERDGALEASGPAPAPQPAGAWKRPTMAEVVRSGGYRGGLSFFLTDFQLRGVPLMCLMARSPAACPTFQEHLVAAHPAA
jgi:hypothetical protein